MKPVCVIGMGLSPEDLTAKHLKIIKDADVLVGGKRHLQHFRDYPAGKKEIGKDLKGAIRYIKTKMQKENVVVLASGDPLFFGIGSLLIKSLGPDNVVIYPNISTVAAAFSRIKEPWNDVSVISLHGRDSEIELFKLIASKDKIAVYTDPEKNPAWIAKLLIQKNIIDFNICVFEKLGTSSERFKWYTIKKAAGMKFSEPNLAVLKRIECQPEKKHNTFFGMPDKWYDHNKGLITKAEVRAVTLSKLRILPEHVLWDLGAGSGSIAIEASILANNGMTFAVEQKKERVKQIDNNRKRFRTKNMKVIKATLPKGLEKLPEPDRIFIGGGGRNLKNIIIAAAGYLKPDGIIVINTILIPSIETALETLKQLGFKTDIVQVQISRSKEMSWGEMLGAENPVWIITGIKTSDL